MTFRTNALKVQAFAGALFGVQVGTTTMAQVNADITSNGGLANTLNGYYASSFGSATTASVAATVAANLGLTGSALTAGAAYVEAQLNAAAPGARGAVISNILDLFAGLASDATYGAAATAWNARVTAANSYTGAANVAMGTVVAQSEVFTLTTSANTLTGTAGNDTVYGFAAASSASPTYQSADIIDGGAGNDTLSLVVSGTSTDIATVTNVETIQLRATDTASISLAGIAGVTALRNDNSVANLTVTGLRSASTIGISNTTDDTAVTYATSGLGGSTRATVTLQLNTVGVSTDLAVATVTAGANDTVRTLNIEATGSNFVTIAEDGIGETVTTLNVSGAGSVTVRSAAESGDTVGSLEIVTTVDASTNTGGVTVDLATGANAADVTVTGGTGNDRIIFTDGQLTAADKVSLGDGTTDTIALHAASGNISYTSSSAAAAINAVTGAERVEFGVLGSSTADLTLDVAMSNITASTIVVGGNAAWDSGTTATDAAGDDTIDVTAFTNTDSIIISRSITGGKGGTEAATTVAVTAGNNGGVAIDVDALVDSPSNAIAFTLNGVTITGGAGGDGANAVAGGNIVGGDAGNGAFAIDINEFDAISIVTGGTAASSLVAGGAGTAGATTTSGSAGTAGSAASGAISVAAGADITVSGTQALTMGTIVAGSGAVTLNAKNLVGALSVTTTAYGDVVVGGAGNDTITAGDGIDQIDLTSGGKDTVVNAVTAAANRDLITGFTAGSGGDVLDLSGTIAATDAATVITGTAASFTLASDKVIYEFAFEATANSADLDASVTGSELGKAFSSGSALTSLTTASAEAGYIVAYDNGNAYVYYFDAGSSDTTLTLSSEVALIGVVFNVAVGALNMDNFA